MAGMEGNPLKVTLVSDDRILYDLCREVLLELSLPAMAYEQPGSQHAPADLRIWDLTADTYRDAQKTGAAGEFGDLFVVARKSLPEVQKLIPTGAFAFLLKPVQRPVLRAFLASALNRSSGSRRTNGTEGDAGNRHELLQALLETNVRLQECDQDRTNFLARALHDFRTPLTALQGYCDMLIRQKTGSLQPDQIELLQRMQHSIRRLAKMSNSMFELSIHHNTDSKPNLVRSSIDVCVQNAVHQITPISDEKGIVLSIDLEPHDTHLYFDPAAIEQVLVNLLENACKFTPRGGAIQIRGRLSYSDQRAELTPNPKLLPVYRIELLDTGSGILPEHLESIFEEFTSYAGARDRSGGGLGLAICKMLVTAHGGSIWAESSHVGTKISFTLPVRQNVILKPAPLGAQEDLATVTH